MRFASASRRGRVLAGVQRQLGLHYPTLRLEVDGAANILGSFPVCHDGAELDRFLVRIELPDCYPDSPPRVFEIGGRVPHDLDRHVIPADGSACLYYHAVYWMRGFHKRTITDFLRGPVQNFFLYQCAVEEGVSWPHGELAHGNLGILAFFSELFNIPIEQLSFSMERLLKHSARPKSRCPCGNARSTRECHPGFLQYIEAVPDRVAKAQLEQALKSLNEGDIVKRHQSQSSEV